MRFEVSKLKIKPVAHFENKILKPGWVWVLFQFSCIFFSLSPVEKVWPKHVLRRKFLLFGKVLCEDSPSKSNSDSESLL